MRPLLIVLIFGLTGCTFFDAHVDENTVYQYGKLEAVVDESVKDTDAAVIEALEEMQLTKVSHKVDEFYSVTKAKNAKNEDVVVNLEKATDDSCNLSIKIGLTGDQAFSKALYKHIIDNL